MQEVEPTDRSGLRGRAIGLYLKPANPRLADQALARKRERRRSTYILIGAFWVFAVLMLSVRAVIIDLLPISIMGPRRLAAAAVGALLCLAMARLLELLGNRSFPERVVVGLVGAFLMAVILTTVTMMMNRVILPLPGFGPFNLVESAQWVLVWLGYFLAWTGTHLALTYHWDSQDYQRRAALLAEQTLEAQMAALRYQLNPHFLFNTLNSISSLVGDHRNAEAEAMLLNLATFVRSTLTAGPTGTIALSEEIELQRLYLAIEQVRFGERLKVEIDLPDRLAGARVPALILQPLIENAIRHGVGRSEQSLTIRIAAAAERGGMIEILVENDGTGKASPPGGKSGVGLANVRARLDAHFGARASLEAGPIPDGGFRATLRLPRRIA
jgi:hypothetical protein